MNTGVFRKHLDMIKSVSIRTFTEFIIKRFPDYFWTLMASTSNMGHGKDETLVDHVQGCLFAAEQVIKQFEGHWTSRQNDQLIAALIMHDGWRCGVPGNERRYIQEDIDKSNGKISQDLLGKLRTARDHPEVGYVQTLILSSEFNRSVDNELRICSKDLQVILKGIRYHYGKWTQSKCKPFSLSWPYDSVVMQVHNIDYHQMVNAQYFTRGCKK